MVSEVIEAPHRIPKGKERAVCPIVGMSAADRQVRTERALAELKADPDIMEEERALAEQLQREGVRKPAEQSNVIIGRELVGQFVPLNVKRGAHSPNDATRALVRSIGGVPTLRRFAARFYEKAFVDPHLDLFIRRHEDHHGERFANWIAEKFGDGTPWTEERKFRKADVMVVDGQSRRVAHDRSSAHLAAWNSPKRPEQKQGEHFKPDDARVWMRIHFWAARETGLFEEHPAFMDYYVRFIGHFISVYSSKSPPFTRESVRWSMDQQNIDQYLANENVMADVTGRPLQEALVELPLEERSYTGSKASELVWPYGNAFVR